MKKIFSAAILLLILLGIVLVLGKQKIGDIRPALLPAPAPTTPTKPDGTEAYHGPLKVPDRFKIEIVVEGLSNPRDLEFSPAGTLLVSIPAEGKVVALLEKNPNGYQQKDVIADLNKPHGLAFFEGKLYIAEETRVARYDWREETKQASLEKILFSLPKGGRHFTRTITFDREGRMFISIGSTCDVCFEKNSWHGAVIVSDGEGGNQQIFAKGLRNSVFIAINNQTDELWGTEMGRDFLGDNLPPDEINIIREGKDYGWPVCYGNRVYDRNFGKESQEYCEGTEPPIFEIAAHSAPLGLTFIKSGQFPKEWQGDLLVAYHGSWNRSTPIGYKVVRLDIEGDRIVGEHDFLTGFLQDSSAIARPVDLIFDQDGNLYISDDKGGKIYKVSYKK